MDWRGELIDPIAELAADSDFYISVKAAELIARLPLKSESIARALDENVPRFLDERQAGMSYFAKALMAQDRSEESKANALGDIMRRGIYVHDRFVAVLCASELGVSAKSLLSECQNVMDSMSAGKSSGGQMKRLREAMELIQGTPVKNSSKRGKNYNHPRLQMWMDAIETVEDACSSSTHLLSTIAREQIRRSRDESLVGPVIDALSGKLSPDQYQHLVSVVNCLLMNTGNVELRDWLRRECCREDLKPKQIQNLLYVVQPEVMPMVRRVLFANNGGYSTFCLEHLKRDGADESVDLLCEVGRRDLSLRLLVIFALEETGNPRAIPYLLELAKRDLESKKQSELEWRAYAIHALGKLGDSSVVPELCELMKKQGLNAVVLCALANLGDSRGMLPAIGAVRNILAESKNPSTWSDGIGVEN